ncbi:hypothetical protein GS453_14700 [Rhodococcus hoagii]|uniref:Uncharacterized protein n=1 Tax=Rhodococcus hoagii TaxID=43767 RepID=A0AAP2F325_RHOHA|nr:hypothetical protein [Prescottella equi]MBM4626690.1 hypothetical protein [Prescottella equi]MBM4628063.1 hypothetical protein [Prescottella equi]NKU54958.1 hypothetical protein [Prescottella equi]ORL33089.1 hypothetical protein A6I87_22605 [Prescottella equi]
MAMTAREAQRHIGERVLYTSPVTRQMSGFGVIVSADERWIHVLYPGSREPIKTHPDNLTLDRSSR